MALRLRQCVQEELTQSIPFSSSPRQTLPSNVELHLDINRSGATIAWDYFRSLSTDALLEPSKLARVEEMMSYVQDGDIWTWAIPNVRADG